MTKQYKNRMTGIKPYKEKSISVKDIFYKSKKQFRKNTELFFSLK